jgi:hypothetical protein
MRSNTQALWFMSDDPAVLRALTFVSGELSIELEVTSDALVGQVVPPRAGEIELEGRAGRVPVDEIGWFVIRPVPTGQVRLHLHTADGQSVHTEWTYLAGAHREASE